MYFEERKNKDGKSFYVATERYVDPLTGKRKRASVVYHTNTARARRQAERELVDKIEELISKKQGFFKGSSMVTFSELKKSWFDVWKTTVKPQTIRREILVIDRLSELIADDILLENITPLLIQNCLNEYRGKYKSTHSTMQHIKCTLNKIFDYGVLHNAIPFSPSRVVKLNATVEEKRAKKRRLEMKFLDEREVNALLSELKGRRNQNYYDLALFLIGTGCRIGEASALTESDIDFENHLVTIDKSLQAHDLRVDEYYLDTTKTEAGERVEQLPEFVMQALKRVIERNKKFDNHMENFPSQVFRKVDFLFRTEYGAPITSHSFREILGRVNKVLQVNCQEKYGFEWTKNAIPHSFRHIHISVLRNDPTIPLKEIQARVGHVQAETTNGYTHLLSASQEKSVEAISRFIDKMGASESLA
ncbi:tyrosine-type recombinase/integrase [Lactiplantibacillus plantarum]|uniref:tyrosine-type recombinase/integrase n=1 Tax=Lactobacillaceae TaxID=33958 RepID=UPI000CD3C7EF|nr:MULTISPECIES: site-specific integrase [Lactobacillaceae]POH19307.1 RepB family plasmid replication initiator protein [Fructilactobacillus sanfranciscensis]SPD92531.1 Transposase from transposon Tn916 [Lactiplantibacillus plantarum]VFI63209.1 Transposase from transposon Tn916 [Lactiplantibacillus plantarum]VFQ56696.1 Transposase from transposon Tn916 [Lactiplantibacillus plantarum]